MSGQGLALAFLVACGRAASPSTQTPPLATAAVPPINTPPPPVSPEVTSPLPPPAAATTSATVDVSVDDKIGQMLMVGFRGTSVDDSDPIVADLGDRNLGSVVLFDFDVPTQSPVRNIQSPAQLQALTAGLQQHAHTPLLISIDQEGGQVARLKPSNGFPATLSEQELGAANDLNKTLQNAETIGDMLSSSGINLDLAPVVDLNTNPDNPIIGKLGRSFSADPAIVTANALAEIKGLHAFKVLSTLKHFPGHGSSRSDSHKGFVDVTDTWSRTELEPFSSIIASGQCDAVMTAHIFNAKLDPQWPATLSSAIITGILRQQLGWDGAVVSDDMQMGAISQNYGLDVAVERAIAAGIDILAFANNLPDSFDPQIMQKTIGIIHNLLDTGKLTPDRIDQSYRRIVKLKARLG